MTTQRTDEAHQAKASDTEQEMAKYGITCVPVDYFHLGDLTCPIRVVHRIS